MEYVRAYQIGDADYLAPRLRERDRAEVAAASGRDPLSALMYSAEHSDLLCTVVDAGGRPVGMFGASAVDDDSASVWLLGSDALVQPPLRREFLREGGRFLDHLHAFRPLLFNYVDARNTVHIRWLKWVGFTFIKLHQHYGVEQRPFWEFVRIHHV